MEDGGNADFVPHSSLLNPHSSFFVPGSSFLVPRLRFPRASAGFMILAACRLPSALPAAHVRNPLLCHRDFSISDELPSKDS
jgi:hypothetical protein